MMTENWVAGRFGRPSHGRVGRTVDCCRQQTQASAAEAKTPDAAPAATAASAPSQAALAPAAAASAAKPEPLPFKDWKREGAVGPVVDLAPTTRARAR